MSPRKRSKTAKPKQTIAAVQKRGERARQAAPDYLHERTRRERAQAALKELELARVQGKTMLVEEHEKLLADAFSRVRAKLLNFAPRAAAAAFGATSLLDAQARIEPVVREIMEELAAGDDVPEEL